MFKKILGSLFIAALVIGTAGYFALDHYKRDVYNFATNLGAEKAGLTTKQIVINKHNIHYFENSLKGNKPSLLLVHGFGAFKENWIRLAIELRNDFHVIALDLPGHGASDYFKETNYDIDQQVTMLHEFAKHVISGPFVMAGNSMGGAITALYAATYPNDVTAAILLDPGHINEVKSQLDIQLENGVHPLIVDTEEQFAELVEFAMEQPPFLPWPMSAVSTLRMAERKHKNEKIWIDISQNPGYDFKTEIRNVKAPTLIAWGKEDRVLNYKNAYIFKNLIPNSSVQIFENVGHVPMVEIPIITAETLRNFVKENS